MSTAAVSLPPARLLEQRREMHVRWAASGTALACAVGLLAPDPPLTAQIFVLFLGVLLLGFPHGTLDPLIILQRVRIAGRGRLVSALALYLSAAAAGLGVWMLSPLLGLALFLGVSALHFGLGDVSPEERVRAGRLAPWLVAVRGLAAIALPTAAFPGDAGRVFSWLLEVEPEPIVRGLSFGAPWIVSAIVLAGLAIHMALSRIDRSLATRSAAEVLCLAVAFVVLPPLLSFTIYFCGWHSIRHLIAVDTGLGSSERRHVLVTVLLVSAATLLLVAGLHFLLGAERILGQNPEPREVLRTVFVSLAVLTPPHVLVTHWLERVGVADASPQRPAPPRARPGTSLEKVLAARPKRARERAVRVSEPH